MRKNQIIPSLMLCGVAALLLPAFRQAQDPNVILCAKYMREDIVTLNFYAQDWSKRILVGLATRISTINYGRIRHPSDTFMLARRPMPIFSSIMDSRGFLWHLLQILIHSKFYEMLHLIKTV